MGKVGAAAPRAKRAILLFLTGGPAHQDTFDLKPDAPVEFRGEFKPIPSTLPGLTVCEHLPLLAQRMNRFCVVRSLTHQDTVHTSAGYTVLTGAPHPLANSQKAELVRPSPVDHPHLGSVLSKVRSPTDGVPVFVSLPEIIKDAAVNEFPGQGGGLLGRVFDPFRIDANVADGRFRTLEVAPAVDVPWERLRERDQLLRAMSPVGRSLPAGPADDLTAFRNRALNLLQTSKVYDALQWERESAATRDRYGKSLFGKGCLLARRLSEVGVGLVTVYWHYEGPEDSPVWDTHGANFRHLRDRLLPPTDLAISALVDDLASRGLLEETLVVAVGEFGRAPKVNAQGGRDHWPHVGVALLAGGGVAAGSIVGASDRIAAYPSDNPVTPADLMATLYHLLGIPADMELRDQLNRPIPACSGRIVNAILA